MLISVKVLPTGKDKVAVVRLEAAVRNEKAIEFPARAPVVI